MKLDVSKITGFDAMSDEEKVKALLGMDVPDAVDMSLFVEKNVADKYASEAADWKKKYNSKLTEDEARREAEAEKNREMEEKYNALLKKTAIAENTSKYLKLGYDESLAKETAEALFNGDMDKVFANGEKYKADLEKKIKADVLKSTPKPEGAGSGKAAITKEQFNAMGYSERIKLKTENLELYNKMMNGGNE